MISSARLPRAEQAPLHIRFDDWIYWAPILAEQAPLHIRFDDWIYWARLLAEQAPLHIRLALHVGGVIREVAPPALRH